MMSPAKWDGVFVTDSAAERPELSKSQMVGIARPAAAYEARLHRYELEVRAVAVAARLTQG
jgi:hypothetical protein